MDVRIGSSTLKALLDTGSSVSFFGPHATAAAQASGAKPKADVRVLRLESGWSQSTMSPEMPDQVGCRFRRQQFLCVPDLCRDVVLGRDFLTVSGISLHVSLGGWTVGTEPQKIVPFVKAVKDQPEAVDDDFGDSLRCIFAEGDASVCACVPEATAACNVIIPGHSSDLDPRMKHILEEFREIFTTTPGCTTLAEHRIDTGDNPPVRRKLRPVNAKKQAIMDNCIQDLLAQNLIRPSQSQHASAPVLVEKSGGYRMAVDYRQLNARTKVPVYPMPRTDWLLAQLGRASTGCSTPKHITDDCIAKADVVELYSRIGAVLLKVFDGRTLGRRVSTGILKELLPQLLMVLLDKRITELRHGPHLQRTVNILALHIIRNGNPTCVLGALITHLHDCLGNVSTQSSEKYIDLVVKCLWKMMSSLENIVDELSLDMVLLDLHLFLKAYRGSFWEGRPSDTPLRTVRTIIYKLVGLKGHKLLTYAEMVPEISANRGFSDDSQNKSNDESEQKSVHQQFKNVVVKLNGEDDFDEQILVLHRLCKKNPSFNLDRLLSTCSPRIREIVRTRLNELEKQPPGSNVAHVLPLRMNDTNRHSYSSSPRKGDLSKLPKDYVHWSRKQWATRLNSVFDQLNFKRRFTVDDYPSSEEIPDIFSEPLHVTEARYQQMIQRSEEMTKTALQIIADFRNRDKSQKDSEC
ncbi:hypothetical protein MRX96_038669 [Rhipicephalus microplus]